MQAQNQQIPDWLDNTVSGAIRLPRFQRGVVWPRETTRKFLEAILFGHPLGVMLLLGADGEVQPFKTTKIRGAPSPTVACQFHLLDGQQRLTALLKSVKDSHEDGMSYYIKFTTDKNGKYKFHSIEHHSQKRPWREDKTKVFDRNLLPFTLLDVRDGDALSAEWQLEIGEQKGWTREEVVKLSQFISKLKETFNSTNIPYLLIPSGTEPEEAIQIFINMNTSTAKLNHFDITNAQFEQKKSRSLSNYVRDVKKKIPELSIMLDSRSRQGKGLGDLILRLACMDQDKPPQEGNYSSLNFDELARRLPEYKKGLVWTQDFLKDEGIWSDSWLPSKAPIRVLPLLYPLFNKYTRENKGKATNLIRSYLWRSFFTDWYTKKTNGRIFNDYRLLKKLLKEEKLDLPDTSDETIFNLTENPLPTVDNVLDAGWPTSQNTLIKSLLALSICKGAEGLETGEPLTPANYKPRRRELHHIYPKKILQDCSDPDLAINCMYIEKEANRSWNSMWPGDWLAIKVEKIGGRNPELTVGKRLDTHFVPSEHLIKAKQTGGTAELKDSYNKFCELRSTMIFTTIESLFNFGEYPPGS